MSASSRFKRARSVSNRLLLLRTAGSFKRIRAGCRLLLFLGRCVIMSRSRVTASTITSARPIVASVERLSLKN